MMEAINFLATSPWMPCIVQAGVTVLVGAAVVVRQQGGMRAGDGPGGGAQAAAPGARVLTEPDAAPAASPGPCKAESAVLTAVLTAVPAAPAAASEPARPEPPRILMGASDQLRDFLTWMICEGYAGKYTDREWVSTYLHWARARSIAALPDGVFLGCLGKHPCVSKSRDRIKDRATGRVLRTPAGTPLRNVFYTLTEPEPQRAGRDQAVAKRRRAARKQAEAATFSDRPLITHYFREPQREAA